MRTTHKISKFFSCLSLFLLLILTSCEGFFTNNDVDEKIRAAIDYANAPYSTFVVSADSNAGTIIPSGQVNYKPTDLQNIEFTCNPTYEFLGWEFSYKQTSQAADTPTLTAADKDWWKDYINIKKETQSDPDSKGRIVYTLQIEFKKAAENLLISPKCGKKPMVEQIRPDTVSSGVSRDTEVSITFDTIIADDCFYFTQAELAELAASTPAITSDDYLYDNQKVYGYKKSGLDTVYKGIKIYVDGKNKTELFTAPVIKNDTQNKSRIIFSPKNKLPCPEDGTAVVTIELDESIKTKDGVALNPVTLSYIINSESLSKVYINLNDYNTSQGTLSPSGNPYVFDTNTEKEIKFVENEAYQFLHWECNNSKIKFNNNNFTANPTTIYSIEEIKEASGTKIVPVSIKRPVFNSSAFNSEYSGTKHRDQDIVLKFELPENLPDGTILKIPADAEFGIECSGGHGNVRDSFGEPQINNDNGVWKITLNADTNNRISLNGNETPIITVTIPDSIYYEYTDGSFGKVNVSLGKKQVVKYQIGNTTNTTTAITFSKKNDANKVGNVLVNNTPFDTTELTRTYFIDDTTNIKYEQNTEDDYVFLYWVSTNANVSFADRFNPQTSITVNGSGDTTIYPKCAPKIKILSIEPSESVNPCNSNIIITTNVTPTAFSDDFSENGNRYSYITISYNGAVITEENFEQPVIQAIDASNPFAGATITYNCKKKLVVPQGTTQNVKVSILDNFFYDYPADAVKTTSTQVKIQNGGYAKSFTVSEDTKKKIYVKFAPSKTTIDTTPFDNYWDSETNSYVFNEDCEFDFNFTVETDYNFNDWNINNGVSAVPTSIIEIKSQVYLGQLYYTLKTNKADNTIGSRTSPIIIGDDSSLIYKARLVLPDDYSSSAGVPYDSDIVLKFNWNVSSNFVSNKPWDGISISINGQSLKECFEDPVYNSIENAITIKSKYDGGFRKYFTSNIMSVNILIGTPYLTNGQTLSYIINNSKETNPPELEGFAVKKSYNSEENCLLVDFEDYDTGEDAVTNIKRNWVNKLYFSGTVTDVESGLKAITINEKLIRTVDGYSVLNPTVFSTVYNITGKNINLQTIFSTSNYYSFKSNQDGLIRIELVITDQYDNECIRTLEVIKDSKITPVVFAGAGSIKISSNKLYYVQQALQIDNNSNNYKNILFTTKAQELVITTSENKKYYKRNYDVSDNSSIGYLEIGDNIYIKYGKNGQYGSAENCNASYTDNLTNFISGDGNYFSKYQHNFHHTDYQGNSTIMNKPCNVFIDPSLDEDIYVKYTTKDEIGNEEENILMVPHAIKTVGLNESDSTHGSVHFSEAANANMPLKSFYIRDGIINKLSDSHDDASWVTSNNSSNINPQKIGLTDGDKFCVVNRFNLLFRDADTYTYRTSSLPSVTNPEQVFQSPIPDFTITTSSGPANSNQSLVSVTFSDTSLNLDTISNLGYKYYIRAKTGTIITDYAIPQIKGQSTGNDYYYPLQNFSFLVTSGQEYSFTLYITDNSTFIYESSVITVSCLQDTVAPVISLPGRQYRSNYLTVTKVTEASPVLYNGKPYLLYSLSNYSLTEEEFDNSLEKRMIDYTQDTRFNVPIYCGDNIFKFLNIKLFDSYGNSKFLSNVLSNVPERNYKEECNLTCTSIIDGLKIYEDEDDEESEYTVVNRFTFNYTKQNPNNDKGQAFLSYYDTATENWTDDSDYYLLDSMTLTAPLIMDVETLRDTFYKVFVWEFNQFYEYYPPIYIYPKGFRNEINCNLKNLIDYNGIITVLCDQPALVHTLFSVNDYGSDINKWELYGGAINQKMISGSTNYDPDALCINQGDYYVVVAHFADGTSAISNVYQK